MKRNVIRDQIKLSLEQLDGDSVKQVLEQELKFRYWCIARKIQLLDRKLERDEREGEDKK